MPDDHGRLGPNELNVIRGGTGKAFRAPDSLGAAASFSMSDMLNAAVPQEHAAAYEAVKKQGESLRDLSGQSDSLFKFMKDFRQESSGNFEKYKQDLGAKNFDAIFGKAIKSGDYTQGRPLTETEKDRVETATFFQLATIQKLGMSEADRFGEDVGKFRKSLGLPSKF